MPDATVDLVTLAEIKPGLNIPPGDTSDDTELAVIITAVSQRVAEMCGPVVNVARSELYDGGGFELTLRNAAWSPTASLGTVTVVEYDTAGTAGTLTAETQTSKPAAGFLVVADEATISRRSSGAYATFAAGRRNVLVGYTTGRAANTAAVSPKFKQAAIITINHIWQGLGAQSTAARAGAADGMPYGLPPWALPKAAIDLLHGETIQLGVG